MEVTIDPSVAGTVELLDMITDPKVSLKKKKKMEEGKSGNRRNRKCDGHVLPFLQEAAHPEKLYKLGQAVRAKVVEVNAKPQRFLLSLTGRRTNEIIQAVVWLDGDCDQSVLLAVETCLLSRRLLLFHRRQ